MKARLTEIHEWIVAGKISLAKRALLELSKKSVSGVEQATELASLYRRVDWNSRGLKVLAPFVIGRGRLLPQSNPQAKLEYADCLKNLGLLNESRKILLQEGMKELPRAKFILGLSYLHDYELKKSEKILFNLYIHTPPAFSLYQKQVIGVNLLMAMLHDLDSHERQVLFQQVFIESKTACKLHDYQLLLHHLMVIELQFKVLSCSVKKIDLASEEMFQDLPDFSRKTAELYVLMGHFVLHEKNQTEFLKGVQKLRNECSALRLFEVVREIDFHSARLLQQGKQLERVYQKTANSKYRLKITHVSKMVKDPSSERVILGVAPHKTKFEFDLTFLKDEPLLVRMLLMMSQEQYTPLSTHFLWNALMPDRHYIEPSSRQSIHQLVKRLRQFFDSKNIPLHIDFDETGYRLKVVGKWSVRITWPKSWGMDSIQNQSLNYLLFFESLRKNFSNTPKFKLKEVMQLFPQVSRRTIQFFLTRALGETKLDQFGKNKGAYYCLIVQ